MIFAYDHITHNAPDSVRSRKLTCVEPAQYWDGGPPGNCRCCRHFFPSFDSFLHFLTCFLGYFVSIESICELRLSVVLIVFELEHCENGEKFGWLGSLVYPCTRTRGEKKKVKDEAKLSNDTTPLFLPLTGCK